MIASRRPNPSSIYFSTTMLKFFESAALFHKNPIFPSNPPKPPTFPVKSFDFRPRNRFSTAADANPFAKVSRTGRVDAQNALFDYLHSTRSFHYTDAEHVSKNSPAFLHTLLSKVDGEEDVGRSVTRFLRYNPINEFEPFFESLGLKPAELHPLLPRNVFFLSDDGMMLENYHALCNYGVPRSKIGRMFKETREMFGYGEGVLSSRLRAYEGLGLSRPTIIKLVTCCPALLVGDLNEEFLKVLEKLKDFGVELDWIRGCLSDKSMYNWNRILDMLNFLDGIGCGKKDLARLIKVHPRFVFDDSGKKIYLLVAMLLKLGLKRDGILGFFEHYPRILNGNFMKNLWNAVQFLLDIGMETEDIVGTVSSHAEVLGAASCMRPMLVLERLNISAEELCEIIKEDPNRFSDLATRRKSSGGVHLPKIEGTFVQEKITFLLKIGFVENSEEIAKALSRFRGRGDQLQGRFDCLVNAGLDCHTVAGMIKVVPPVLNQSTDVIEKKLDYLLNHLGYPVESLVAFPTFLCYSLEKIRLRFSMYKWLKENGVMLPTRNRRMLMSTVALSTLLACSDARFIKYVVNLHPEGPRVWERLKSSSSST
ncbi:transcription termination factor MTEF18, mitochondrial-like [Iris pallida]|uniref:Transcription termination factor MTEF18, mitochondrial-like n=1 Tax=Iris pallida TaxID=29817 RepID=A0AAX6IBR6_IRIPA|nr:transcription termination factor MTEF18, mitochondrial-like [Iris pallida]